VPSFLEGKLPGFVPKTIFISIRNSITPQILRYVRFRGASDLNPEILLKWTM